MRPRAFDPEAWKLFYDYWVLAELEAESDRGLDPAWAGELLFELNQFANVYDENNRTTWKAAAQFLQAAVQPSQRNAHARELSAIGHAHIDTAWLWPLAETWRESRELSRRRRATWSSIPTPLRVQPGVSV